MVRKLINKIKFWLAERKKRKELKERIKKLQQQDPFIYK